VSKQTGKGRRHQTRASAIERKATKHQEFVGQADGERAEARLQKHERLQGEEDREMAREMASELEQVAGLKGVGAVGPELCLRIPRSVGEAMEIVREAPEALRAKARERLQRFPQPAQKALHLARSAAVVLFAPLRLGLQIGREVVRLSFSVLRALRQREA
jgi:hypothetical protein